METLEIQKNVDKALIKENITDKVIARLKEDFGGLTIAGVEDKAGYQTVKDARTNCRSIRKVAEKICKDGRTDAIAIQKAWVAKEKEVVGQIKEVEDYLAGQQKSVDDEIARIKLMKQREAELPARKEKLVSLGIEKSDEELMEMNNDQFAEFVITERGRQLEEKEAMLKQQEADVKSYLREKEEDLKAKEDELKQKENKIQEVEFEDEMKGKEKVPSVEYPPTLDGLIQMHIHALQQHNKMDWNAKNNNMVFTHSNDNYKVVTVIEKI